MLKKFLILTFGLALLASCGGDGGNGSVAPPDTSEEETPPPTEVKEYKVVDDAKCQAPQTIGELTSGMKKQFHQITSNNQAALSLFGFGGVNVGKKETILLVDFMQHKDVSCNGDDVRYGVGARLFLHIKRANMGAKFEYSKLPNLAANVQLGKATVEYELTTIGITGPEIKKLMPKSSSNVFDVDGYKDVMMAVDRIVELSEDGIPGVNIAPQVIPTEEG